MGELQGKVAVVTGSTRGIGRAVAERVAAEDARVMVHGRDAAVCASVASSLRGAGGYACDITDAGAADALVDAAVVAFGTVDIVVNNAGPKECSSC